METEAKTPTHEDWLKAKDKRERAAMECVLALNSGNTVRAMQRAVEADAHDKLMTAISKTLDG